MTENQKFKFKVDKYDLPTKEQPAPAPQEKDRLFGEGFNYGTAQGYAIDLQLKDGNRHMALYGTLLHAHLEYTETGCTLKLAHSVHTVLITGFRLEKLYEKLLLHSLSMVKASQDTHLALADDNEPFILDIEIEWPNR